MENASLDQLPLPQLESIVKQKGKLIDAEDFYSFITVNYLLEKSMVSLIYDYSGKLIDSELTSPDTTN